MRDRSPMRDRKGRWWGRAKASSLADTPSAADGTSRDGAETFSPPTDVATTPLVTLRGRILTVFLSLILVIFAAIILALNLLVDSYISSTSIAQLSEAVASHPIASVAVGDDGSQGGQASAIPNITIVDRGPLGTRPAVFRMDSAFEPVTPTGASEEDAQTAADIAAALKSSGRSPDATTNTLLRSHSGSYYVSCVPTDSGDYLVFYVDVTALTNLADSVNNRLFQILVAAIIVTFIATFLITRRLTRPLAHLTDFARRLGQGDFSPYTRTFHDKEMAVLAGTMNQAAHHLDAYDKDQKTFFQNASHELRTPLMAITCQAEGISFGLMEPKEASGKILAETARLTDMVEELLSISRLDTITNGQATTRCDVPGLLTGLVDEQRHEAAERNVRINLTSDESGVVIDGNVKTLSSAFTNLLSNAVRYARHRIDVACQRQGDHVIVTVSDDGPGIADEDLPHIFERFYKGAGGVHGIGLAIVKSVVDQHRGQIQVSTSGEGTCFRLTLPAAEG